MTTETVLFVAQTPKGAKVEYRHHQAYREGVFEKGYTRYFYDYDDPVQAALDYAERKADNYEDYTVETGRAVEGQE